MDIYANGDILSIGNTRMNVNFIMYASQFTPKGILVGESPKSYGTNCLIREVIASGQGATLTDCIDINTSTDLSTLRAAYATNTYTRYNTNIGGPDTDPYPWAGYRQVVGPSIAKGASFSGYEIYVDTTFRYTRASIWIVGSFTDIFKLSGQRGTFSTLGKADCFIARCLDYPAPVCLQWGGTENDLAYDVASDDIGNATIFLRAGSDFPITSATQSLVRMNVGYNVVRLDTNGLLTETFPVRLEAAAEITDTQIALGRDGTVYVLAKDEARKQYFLAKVLRSGTAWSRYLPDSVSKFGFTSSNTFGREPRMGLTVDSKGCAYVTGNFTGTADLGSGVTLSTRSLEAFVAKYSPSNTCLGALKMGYGMGVTVRLSPQEDALYVNGWGEGSILGTSIPTNSRGPGAFLVKLKLTK
jgi:hypothetical protein